jgi:hypothetical protein
MRRFLLLLGLLLLLPLTFAAPAQAATPVTTLTFDELPFQPVDGLSFRGVTFGFQVGGVPSADAHYGAFGPGTTVVVQDPSLEGDSNGTLTLTFDKPTTVLEFGIARSCFCTLTPGVSVELFQPRAEALGRPRPTVTETTSPLVFFSEAHFSYSGLAVKRAVITFPSAGVAPRFALDNLTFEKGWS